MKVSELLFCIRQAGAPDTVGIGGEVPDLPIYVVDEIADKAGLPMYPLRVYVRDGAYFIEVQR